MTRMELPEESSARVVNVLSARKKPRAKKVQARAALVPSTHRRQQSQVRELQEATYSYKQVLGRIGDADVDSEELEEAMADVEDAEAGENYVDEEGADGDAYSVARTDRRTRSASSRRSAAADVLYAFEADAADDGDEADVEEEEEEEEEDDADEAMAPVVFQCGTCRSIFGDSYAFVGANADLLLVTLSDATNVALAPETQTAREGPAAGASFHELLCKQCQAVLGRQYRTTPSALDELRGLYSFSTAAIASYQLGYPQLERQGEPVGADAAKQATAACDSTLRSFAADRDELVRLRGDMSKVQNLLLVLDQRMRALEAEEPDSETDARGGGAAEAATPVKR